MKKRILAAFAVAVMAAGIALRAMAAGASFTYQGVLREVGGEVPSVKNKVVQFRIYDTATGGHALWGRSYPVLLDENGLFNVALSDDTGTVLVSGDNTLAKTFAHYSGTTLYIGITVDGSSGEISPRQTLLPVPWAIHAADVAAASGNFTIAGKATISGGMEVAAGDTKVKNLEADSLVVNGNIAASSSGTLSGFGTIPIGGIIMWSGSRNDIPSGWALCDGTWYSGRQTPDLRNRFIVGAGGEYSPGNTGGAKEVALSANQMPNHSHSLSMRVSGYSGSRSALWEVYGDEANGVVAGWRGINTSAVGGGAAHENRPPYYALCFIMRVR